MVKTFEGKRQGSPARRAQAGQNKTIGIVASKFNDFITKRLLKGCLEELARRVIPADKVTVAWVPGAFEIPLAALKMAKKREVHTVICLGAVIRGETLHFDLVARVAADGVAQASLLSGKPVIFGILTTDTVDQAYKRSGEKGNNKGRDAAIAALEMADVLASIDRG